MTTVNTREEQAPIEHETRRRSASRRPTPAGWGDSARRAPCRKPTFSAAGRGWRRRPLLCLALAVAAVCLSAVLVPAGAAADWNTDLNAGPGFAPSITAVGSTPYLAWSSSTAGSSIDLAAKPGLPTAAWQFFPPFPVWNGVVANIGDTPYLVGEYTQNFDELVGAEVNPGSPCCGYLASLGARQLGEQPEYGIALAGDGPNFLVTWIQVAPSNGYEDALFGSAISTVPTPFGVSSPEWSSPDLIAGPAEGRPSATTVATGQGAAAYVAFMNGYDQVQVVQCAGGSPNVCADVGGPFGTGVDQVSITAINGVPYVAWTWNYMGNTEVSAERWNGSSWQYLGVGGFAFVRGYEPGVAITGVDGQPWVAYSDPDHTHVSQFSPEPGAVGGGGWEQVGRALEPDGNGTLSMTTTSDGVPWLAIGASNTSGYSEILVQYLARLQPLAANLTATQLRSGARLAFTLPAARTIHLAFTQLVAGREVAGRCVAKTARNRTKPRCMRTVTRGTLVTHGHKGSNSLVVRPHLSNKTLSPGRYELKLTAVTSSGVSSIPNWVTVKL